MLRIAIRWQPVSAATVIWGFIQVQNTSGSTPKDYQEASNAAFTFNGVAMERASNTINDVVTGVTLSLNAVHSNNSDSETISVTSDQTTLKTKLQSLVAAYNDTQFALNELSDPDSDEDEVGGLGEGSRRCKNRERCRL